MAAMRSADRGVTSPVIATAIASWVRSFAYAFAISGRRYSCCPSNSPFLVRQTPLRVFISDGRCDDGGCSSPNCPMGRIYSTIGPIDRETCCNPSATTAEVYGGCYRGFIDLETPATLVEKEPTMQARETSSV